MKEVIGIIPLYDDEKDSYWMLPGYMKAIEKASALPIMFPLTTDTDELDDLFKICDGILFTGGHDVDPQIYGEKKKAVCGDTCNARDEMEAYLLDKSLKEDKPVFGICRGIQFFNAHLGGKLYQDLPTEHESSVEHHMSPPYDKSIHKVEVYKDSILADIIGEGIHDVNSYHHQAIKELSNMLQINAVSEDGLIEAVSVKDKRFALAVQWHPEFSFENNEDSMKLIKAFVNACK